MARRPSEGLGAALLAAVAGALGGCQTSETTAEWESWTYQESEALTTAQQIERAQAWQADFAPLTEGPLSAPAEIPSNTLSEQERRAIQERYAREQRLEVEAFHERTNRIERESKAAPSRE